MSAKAISVFLLGVWLVLVGKPAAGDTSTQFVARYEYSDFQQTSKPSVWLLHTKGVTDSRLMQGKVRKGLVGDASKYSGMQQVFSEGVLSDFSGMQADHPWPIVSVLRQEQPTTGRASLSLLDGQFPPFYRSVGCAGKHPHLGMYVHGSRLPDVLDEEIYSKSRAAEPFKGQAFVAIKLHAQPCAFVGVDGLPSDPYLFSCCFRRVFGSLHGSQRIGPLLPGDSDHALVDPPQGECEYGNRESRDRVDVIPVSVNEPTGAEPQIVDRDGNQNIEGGAVFWCGVVVLLAIVWWALKRN